MKESELNKNFIPEGSVHYCHVPFTGVVMCYTNIVLFFKENFASTLPENYRTAKPKKFRQEDFRTRFLTDREIEKVNSHKTLKKQAEWMSGRFSAKRALMESNSAYNDFSALSLDYKEQGAPYFVDSPDILLSISHSGDFAVAAVTDESISGIGIDIERIRDLDISAFSRVAFTERERSELEKASIDEIIRRFTIKEAYLKYIGTGFNEPLAAIEEYGNYIYFKKELQSNLKYLTFYFSPEYIISILYTL